MTVASTSVVLSQAALLAKVIYLHLKQAEAGHCLRVNNLDTVLCNEIIPHLKTSWGDRSPSLISKALLTRGVEPVGDVISSDKAVEYRNRKDGVFCLLVPAGADNQTASSLGNSFAELNGAKLISQATILLNESGDFPDTQNAVSQIRAAFPYYSRPTDSELLDYAIEAAKLEQAGRSDNMGIELWRVGLLPDAKGIDPRALKENRRLVNDIARPRRIGAPLADRLSKRGLSAESRRLLSASLRTERLDNAKEWTERLAQNGVTFDKLVFTEKTVPSNLQKLAVAKFVDEQGELIRKPANGLKQDGPQTPLFAKVGDAEKLWVKWETEPKKVDVQSWRVDIVPADESHAEDAELYSLPGVAVRRGTARKATIKLAFGTFASEEIPKFEVCVRIAPLDSTGETYMDPATNKSYLAYSDPFYLTTRDILENTESLTSTRERFTGSRSLAEGELDLLVRRGFRFDALTSPKREAISGVTTFSMTAVERKYVKLTQSQTLWELQRSAREAPESLGIFTVSYSEQQRIFANDVSKLKVSAPESDHGKKFVSARKSFFNQFKNQGSVDRDCIEVADWSNAALLKSLKSYVSAWTDWLSNASGDEIHTAASIDTLHVLVQDGPEPELDAVVVLPTHPLRALWFGAYSALLASWAKTLREDESIRRKQAIDVALVGQLTPANLPMLVHHPDFATDEPATFFRSLDLGHGVAIRSKRSDEAEQFIKLQEMVCLPSEAIVAEVPQHQRAALAMKRFLDSHPYADPLRIALVHPDDGTFLRDVFAAWKGLREGEVLKQFAGNSEQDEIPPVVVPSIEISVYEQENHDGLNDLVSEQWLRGGEISEEPSDHLRPALSITRAKESALAGVEFDVACHQHHLAVIQDLTEPMPAVMAVDRVKTAGTGLAFYGLIARHTVDIEREITGTHFSFRVDPTLLGPAHPVDKGLSDGLSRGIAAANSASARLLGGSEGDVAVQTISLGGSESSLIAKLHDVSDWVVFLDRFVGPEFFDSPAGLNDRRTYILDASPTFQDGMSRQLFVTTTSRDEVELILWRAMEGLGFTSLKESVGRLLSTLRRVSGRLLLDALQNENRAKEVVGIGAAMTWLEGQDQLSDTVIVPIDAHTDLFTNSELEREDPDRRADLALFRFATQKRLEIRIVEVKARTTVDDGTIGYMTAQMTASGTAIEDRLGQSRVDLSLQRARITQLLRFYLDRALRYGTIDADEARKFRAGLENLEKGSVEVERINRGFVIALNPDVAQKAPYQPDILTETRVLSIPEIVRATAKSSVDLTPIEIEENDAPEDASKADKATALPDELDRELTGASSVSQDVVLGRAGDRDIVWSPRVAGSPHMFILGIPGQGKSVTIERILTELAKSKTPSLILDFHGTFANPNNPVNVRTGATLIDASDGLPFSPFSLDRTTKPLHVNQHSAEIADVIDHVFGLGPIQRDTVYTTLKDLYVRRGYGSWTDGDPIPEPVTISDIQRALARQEQNSNARNVIARTRSLFDFDLFSQGYEHDRFDDFLRNGVVIGLNNLGGDDLALSLSAFLLRRLYFSITKWPVADRLKLVIVLDEAHRLAKDITLPKIMKEARKFGVAVVVASQGLTDFHPNVVGNAGTKISFRINHPDSRKVAGFFQSGPDDNLVEVLERLSPGKAIIQTSEMPRAARVDMFLPGD